MTPYVVGIGSIPDHVFEIFRTMREVVEDFPYLEGETFSSLAVCAVLENHFQVTRVDGYFGRNTLRHSWLTHNDAVGVILDMYPVASASPFILYTGNALQLLAWHGMYRPEQTKYQDVNATRQARKLAGFVTQRYRK